MHPTRRWIVISLAVALLLGAAWYAQHSTLPRRVSRSTPSAEAPFIPGHLRAAARPSAAVRHPGVEGGETTKATRRETLVCGVGAVRIDEKSRAAPFNYVDRVTGPAQGRWQRNLINSDDYRERAAGLLLLSRGWDYDSITGMPTPTHDAVLARDELVQLAAGLDDQSVYAMAVRACDQSYDPAPRDTACDRISLTKWAALDPTTPLPGWRSLRRLVLNRINQRYSRRSATRRLRTQSILVATRCWPTRASACRRKHRSSKGPHFSTD